MLTTSSPSHDLDVAVSAYLARYKDQTRIHADSDLRCFLAWCASTGLDPMQARRVDLELYLRWMQLQRRYKPSTVSRRLSIVAGFYRTADRRGAHRVTGRARPQAPGSCRVTHAGTLPSAVRGSADRWPGLD